MSISNMDWIDQATCKIVFQLGDERLIISADHLKHQLIGDLEDPPEVPEVTPEEFWSDAVTVYGQRDARWSGHHYNGSFTLGGAGCYICAFCMLLDYYYGSDLVTRPDVISGDLNSLDVFYNGMFANAKKAANAYGLVFRDRRNWQEKELDRDDLQYVKEVLRNGPTIMAVDFQPQTLQWESHFVLALWYDQERDDILIADPWNDQLVWLRSSRYSLSNWSLKRSIYGLRVFRRERVNDTA